MLYETFAKIHGIRHVIFVVVAVATGATIAFESAVNFQAESGGFPLQ